VINSRSVNEPAKARRSINLTAPFRCAGWAEKDQVFEAEQRFRFAVTVLLSPKGAQCKAPMVPNDCSGAERNHATGLLQPPAKIDIVTSFMIFGIEAANVFESPAIERHVTPGNVFGDGVGEQDVAGAARRRCDTSLDPILRWRRNVWPAYAGIIATYQRAD
jgi:hypothetical protein